jgi:hypothetical protein
VDTFNTRNDSNNEAGTSAAPTPFARRRATTRRAPPANLTSPSPRCAALSNPSSKRLYKLIKSENHAISAYENASKEGAHIAGQLSEWGESTNDEALSDVSDKLGVLLAEIAEQEDLFAQGLEDSRSVLKQIRNTESSVQPSRTHKQKVRTLVIPEVNAQ